MWGILMHMFSTICWDTWCFQTLHIIVKESPVSHRKVGWRMTLKSVNWHLPNLILIASENCYLTSCLRATLDERMDRKIPNSGVTFNRPLSFKEFCNNLTYSLSGGELSYKRRPGKFKFANSLFVNWLELHD